MCHCPVKIRPIPSRIKNVLKKRHEKRRLSDGVVHEPARHTDPGPRVPLPGDGHTLGDGQMSSNEAAQIPDWTENAVKGNHLFVPCGERSTESCYFPSFQCKQKSSSPRIKCVSCRIVVHAACKEILNQNQTLCRPLYREPLHHEVGNKQTGVTGASEQCRHHWILRKRCEGRCMACKKKFEKDRFNFSSSSDTKQAYRAISCSWCKENYHYSDQCFNVENKLKEPCSMGEHSKLIVPPYWIVKTRRSTRPYRKRSKNCENNKKQLTSLKKSFVVRPKNDYEEKTPLLVFINPRSGGNQGRKVLAEFQYLLNPRQVFDLTQGGPIPALELYKRVPNLRILCCGGDGTCGWVMSAIDEVGFRRNPPVGVLPLGTGNDLSRSLEWGPGYSDTSLSKILHQIENSNVEQMDRWHIDSSDPTIDLPLNVMNNYFSIGVDAAACLKFHSEREANPEKFNSRLGNMLKYANYGMVEFLRITGPARELWKHVTVKCDGVDMTKKLTDLHAINLIVLNIPSYSAGYQPYGKPPPGCTEFTESRLSDRKFEVVACSQQQYANVYLAKGTGQRIAQSKDIVIKIDHEMAGQIDGEALNIQPTTIHIHHRNQLQILKKRKNETDNKQFTSHARSGEMLKLKIIEVVRRASTNQNPDSDSIGDHEPEDGSEMTEVDLGDLKLPLDIDLETNRTRIEAHLREMKPSSTTEGSCDQGEKVGEEGDEENRAETEEDFYYVDAHAENEFEPLQKSRELTLLRDFLNEDEVIRIRRDIQNCHIDSKDNRYTSLSSGFGEDLPEDARP